MKKKFVIGFMIILLCLVGLVGAVMFKTQLKAVSSIRKVTDNLYYMEYVGDYGFTSFLEQGGAKTDTDIAEYLSNYFSKGLYKFRAPEEIFGCSTIAVVDYEQGYIFGRNFDWNDCTALIIKTIPVKGYTSISTANLDFLGVAGGFKSIANKFACLGSTYAPLDGMNEKGLCVAVLSLGDEQQTHQNTGKPGITTTTAIRLLLDGAANTQEAIELLSQYDMHSSAEFDYHFAISDAYGKAVVVEYIDNIMCVTEKPVVTNHILKPGYVEDVDNKISSFQRYKILNDFFRVNHGNMTIEQVSVALAAVSQEGDIKTQWSAVYDQRTLSIIYYHRSDYKTRYNFSLNSL